VSLLLNVVWETLLSPARIYQRISRRSAKIRTEAATQLADVAVSVGCRPAAFRYRVIIKRLFVLLLLAVIVGFGFFILHDEALRDANGSCYGRYYEAERFNTTEMVMTMNVPGKITCLIYEHTLGPVSDWQSINETYTLAPGVCLECGVFPTNRDYLVPWLMTLGTLVSLVFATLVTVAILLLRFSFVAASITISAVGKSLRRTVFLLWFFKLKNEPKDEALDEFLKRLGQRFDVETEVARNLRNVVVVAKRGWAGAGLRPRGAPRRAFNAVHNANTGEWRNVSGDNADRYLDLLSQRQGDIDQRLLQAELDADSRAQAKEEAEEKYRTMAEDATASKGKGRVFDDYMGSWAEDMERQDALCDRGEYKYFDPVTGLGADTLEDMLVLACDADIQGGGASRADRIGAHQRFLSNVYRSNHVEYAVNVDLVDSAMKIVNKLPRTETVNGQLTPQYRYKVSEMIKVDKDDRTVVTFTPLAHELYRLYFKRAPFGPQSLIGTTVRCYGTDVHVPNAFIAARVLIYYDKVDQTICSTLNEAANAISQGLSNDTKLRATARQLAEARSKKLTVGGFDRPASAAPVEPVAPVVVEVAKPISKRQQELARVRAKYGDNYKPKKGKAKGKEVVQSTATASASGVITHAAGEELNWDECYCAELNQYRYLRYTDCDGSVTCSLSRSQFVSLFDGETYDGAHISLEAYLDGTHSPLRERDDRWFWHVHYGPCVEKFDRVFYRVHGPRPRPVLVHTEAAVMSGALSWDSTQFFTDITAQREAACNALSALFKSAAVTVASHLRAYKCDNSYNAAVIVMDHGARAAVIGNRPIEP